jgi:predicted MFS family arabinose efflux permease
MPYLVGATTQAERPHAFALYWSASALGGFLGGLLGGTLPGLFASALGAPPDAPRPYGCALAASMALFVPVIWALLTLSPDRPKDAPGQRTARSSAVPYVILAAIALVCILRVGGEFTARTFFSVFLDRFLSVPTARIGLAVAVANLVSIPAPLLTPLLVAKLGRGGTVIAGVLGVAAALTLLALSAGWLVAALGYACMSLLAAMVRSVWTLVMQEAVEAEWRSMSAGVSNLASGAGVAAMSTIGGYMVTGLGYRSTFLTGSGLVGLGALAFWTFFGPRTRPERAAAGQAD